jgi:hypothetical protein
MNKTAVITLGTRDVQLDKESLKQSGLQLQNLHDKLLVVSGEISCEVREAGPRQDQPAQEGRLSLVKPREAGKVIWEHYEKFRKVICLPILDNFLKKIAQDEASWTLVFIYTDQGEESPHSINDTVYFKDIACRFIQDAYPIRDPAFKEISIQQRPADIDYQYQRFDEIFSKSPYSDLIKKSEKVWLLPQGGLDQVNQALTLQLILHARNKLHLFQQPENQNLREIAFASHFLSSLNREIILDKAKRYDFAGILDFKKDIPQNLSWLITITEIADHILKGKFFQSQHSLKKILNILTCNLKLEPCSNAYKLIENYVKWNEKPIAHRPLKKLTLLSWYYNLHLARKNEEWEDALAAIFRISEHAIKHWMEEHYRGSDPSELDFENLRDERLSQDIKGENKRLMDVIQKISQPGTLEKLKSQEIYLNNPNYRLFAELFNYLREELFEGYTEQLLNQVKKMNELLNPRSDGTPTLRGLRNRMEHRLRRISEEEFMEPFKGWGSIDNLFQTLEILCGAEGFEFFEQLSRSYEENLGPASSSAPDQQATA